MQLRQNLRWVSALGRVALLSGLLLGIPNLAPVQAQGPTTASRGPVTIELTAYKVVRDDNGKEQLLEATKARPGDVLEYRAVYANVSTKEVKNLQATLPIPSATEIILDSIEPKKALASSDGRSFAPTPLLQTVKLPSGATQQRPLPLGEYRTLRWPVGTLSAGEKVTVRARVRLNGTLPSTK